VIYVIYVCLSAAAFRWCWALHRPPRYQLEELTQHTPLTKAILQTCCSPQLNAQQAAAVSEALLQQPAPAAAAVPLIALAARRSSTKLLLQLLRQLVSMRVVAALRLTSSW
jgi:hypothetical protein